MTCKHLIQQTNKKFLSDRNVTAKIDVANFKTQNKKMENKQKKN